MFNEQSQKNGATCQLVQDQASVLQPMDIHSTINSHRNTTCHNDRQLHTYLGSTIGFNDVNRRIAIATSTISKLSPIWTSSRLSLALKMRLCNSLTHNLDNHLQLSLMDTYQSPEEMPSTQKPSAALWASAGTTTPRPAQFSPAPDNHL